MDKGTEAILVDDYLGDKFNGNRNIFRAFEGCAEKKINNIKSSEAGICLFGIAIRNNGMQKSFDGEKISSGG